MKPVFTMRDYVEDALSCQEDFYTKNNGTMLNDDLQPYAGQLSIIFRSLHKMKEMLDAEQKDSSLYITSEVPEDAVILLVDMQERYFREVTDELVGQEKEERLQKVNHRLTQMKHRLLELKQKGHPIYAIVDEEGIHPDLEGLPDRYLPAWAYKSLGEDKDPADSYILHPEIAKEMQKTTKVIVCGLWLELCVYAVARLLQKQGIEALVSIDPALTLENAMIWPEGDEDVVTLRSECDRHGVQLCRVESF